MTRTHPVAELLEHTEWVRRLARTLIADPDRADDVVQQVYLEAVRRPPSSRGSIRSWLARVTRSSVVDAIRSETRRRQREAAVAGSGASDLSTETVAERVALHRELVDAVMRLAPPYREAVMLRYFDDLPPRQIAERTGAPVATVKTRLQRGLAELRGELDQRHGDRGTWCSGLVGLLRPSTVVGSGAGSSVGTLLGGSLMTSKAAIAVVGLALLIALPWMWSVGEPPDAARISKLARESSPASALPRIGADSSSSRRSDATGSASPDSRRGRVIPLGGLTLSEIVVAGSTEPKSIPIELASDGSFRLPLTAARATPGFVSRRAEHAVFGVLESGDLVFVGPSGHLRGQVFGGNGEPVIGARVGFEFDLAELARAALDEPVSREPHRRQFETLSGSDGAFDLGVVPWLVSFRLRVRAEGFEPASLVVFPRRGNLRVELRPSDDGSPGVTLRGTVVDREGAAVSGARVRMGSRWTEADVSGRFELTRVVDWSRPLFAYRRGFQPAQRRFRPDEVLGPPTDMPEIVLRLGSESLEIHGVLRTAEGEPLGGWRIVRMSGTELAPGRFLESALDDSEPRGITTDSEGRFVVGGLLPRDYVVRAFDPRTLCWVDSGAVAAGSRSVELRVDTGARHDVVRGVVVDEHGLPVAGARLALVLSCGPAHGFVRESAVVTNARGVFSISDVPVRGVAMQVSGSDSALIDPTVMSLDREDPDAVRISVVRRVGFRLLPNGEIDGREVEFLDASGQRVEVTLTSDGGYGRARRFPLEPLARAPRIAAPVGVSTLVVYRMGREERRIELPRGYDRVHEIEIPCPR